MICASGVGSSMIKNSASLQRVPLRTLLGHDVPEDALDLINNLLLFNPYKRLTAEQALEHAYISRYTETTYPLLTLYISNSAFRFHNPAEEVEMNVNVIPPLSDDVRLTVDDYRNKLYEIMSTHHHNRPAKSLLSRGSVRLQSDFTKSEIKSRIVKDHERYLKSHSYSKEKVYNTQSEPKVNHTEEKLKQKTVQTRSESKIFKKIDFLPPESNALKASGDYKKHAQSSCDFTLRERVRKKPLNSKSNVYVQSFNSYNPNHGIITQSALMELRAAGLR